MDVCTSSAGLAPSLSLILISWRRRREREGGILNKRPRESKLLASSYPGLGEEGRKGEPVVIARGKKEEEEAAAAASGLAVPLMKQHARQLLPN